MLFTISGCLLSFKFYELQLRELKKDKSGSLVQPRIKHLRMLRGAAGHTVARPGARLGQGSGSGSGWGSSSPSFSTWRKQVFSTRNTTLPWSTQGSAYSCPSGKLDIEFQICNNTSFPSRFLAWIRILVTYVCTILVTCSKVFVSYYFVGWDHHESQRDSYHLVLYEETEAQKGPGFKQPSW